MTARWLRSAGPEDADQVAQLHAESWRRFYRGAYADAFLDGDVIAERRAVWAARLATPGHSLTLLAEDDTGPYGFVHVVFDDDERWGSLVDNLHVRPDRRRGGLGTVLLARAAAAVMTRAAGPAMYLWVLEQNIAAQAFYRARGGSGVEAAYMDAPGGVPTRLNGSPRKLRFVWPDASALVGEDIDDIGWPGPD